MIRYGVRITWKLQTACSLVQIIGKPKPGMPLPLLACALIRFISVCGMFTVVDIIYACINRVSLGKVVAYESYVVCACMHAGFQVAIHSAE